MESHEDRYWHNIKGKYVGTQRVGYYPVGLLIRKCPNLFPVCTFTRIWDPPEVSFRVYSLHDRSILYRFLAKWLNWNTFRGNFAKQLRGKACNCLQLPYWMTLQQLWIEIQRTSQSHLYRNLRFHCFNDLLDCFACLRPGWAERNFLFGRSGSCSFSADFDFGKTWWRLGAGRLPRRVDIIRAC